MIKATPVLKLSYFKAMSTTGTDPITEWWQKLVQQGIWQL
ncbi:hypothetical protein GXM_01856 [Nostoc sphaeroides CCNUC1]|uniref:Uncharacterized protein n=1 Tax=Nostoc sphaeroides CCNUC1 TaxID=2653204 RepID=A0A5P8VVD4_9NOSO|nr:hypothetical protein GXM_01856 [Nostoc sphaeroides CCNUC1]